MQSYFSEDGHPLASIYSMLENQTSLSGQQAQAWLAQHFSNAMHGNYSAEQLIDRVSLVKGLVLSKRTGPATDFVTADSLFDDEDWPVESLHDLPVLTDNAALAILSAQYSNASKNWYSARQLYDRVQFVLNQYTLSFQAT